MKTGDGAGDSPPSAAVAHSDEFCKMSAGSVPPGKLAHTSQNCPRPLTATWNTRESMEEDQSDVGQLIGMYLQQHLYLRQHREPASRVGIVRGIVWWGDDSCVERCYGSNTVREAPVWEEELGWILQVLLIWGAQVGGAEERHNGMTHVPNTPAHSRLPHTKQGANGAVFNVGRQTPQSHRYTFLHRQRQAKAGILPSQAGPQFVTEVEEGLTAHTELIQPIRWLEFCHYNSLPPISARSGGPWTCADSDVGPDPSTYHHLKRWSIDK